MSISVKSQFTGTVEIDTLNSTSATTLKINETNNNATSINTNTTVAQNLTLGTAAYTVQYLRGTTININELGSGDIVLGTNGGSGLITMNRPISINYLPSNITQISQIGYTKLETLASAPSLVSGVETRLMTSSPVLESGVWLIQYTACLVSTDASIVTLSKVYGFDFSTADWFGIQIDSSTRTITTEGLSFSGSFVVQSDGAQQYNIGVNITYSVGTMSLRTVAASGLNSKITRTKIA